MKKRGDKTFCRKSSHQLARDMMIDYFDSTSKHFAGCSRVVQNSNQFLGMDGATLAALRAVVLHESSAVDKRAKEDETRILNLRDRIWYLQCALARIARGGQGDVDDLRQEAERACWSAGMDGFLIDMLAGYCEDANALDIGPAEVDSEFRPQCEDDVDDAWRAVGFKAAQEAEQIAFDAAKNDVSLE